jgi:hypothetical protein
MALFPLISVQGQVGMEKLGCLAVQISQAVGPVWLRTEKGDATHDGKNCVTFLSPGVGMYACVLSGQVTGVHCHQGKKWKKAKLCLTFVPPQFVSPASGAVEVDCGNIVVGLN